VLLRPKDFQVHGASGTLRPAVDAFFDKVKVNDDMRAVRENRLKLAQPKSGRHGRGGGFSKIQDEYFSSSGEPGTQNHCWWLSGKTSQHLLSIARHGWVPAFAGTTFEKLVAELSRRGWFKSGIVCVTGCVTYPTGNQF